MLTVNTIEFAGQKAVINSYSLGAFEILRKSQEKQLAEWQQAYPNAAVKAEQMTEAETRALVAQSNSNDHGLAYRIGQSSNVA